MVKHPEVRRGELLDCAQALFLERGYERTTINDIIGKAGVSKGGFYHHFSSKEEMLEALAARFAEAAVASVQAALETPDLAALFRLNAFLAQARHMKVEDAPQLRAMFDVVFKPENLVLYHRLNAAVVAVMTPVLVRIIAQGKEEGVFNVPDAQAAAEIVLQLGASTHDAVARAIAASGTPEEKAAADALEERLRFQGLAIDRILGLPDGSILFVEPGSAQVVMAAPRP
ncbi:TetR/AcrR family transcriptional regulator [Sphingosinicella sp. LHD-64]|uniref:TetR/AcrR family transcriptional regulator n=1 Tax=Sphingosinicella sp. LHD-64 TaxID=3072139 RepID=UPI00280FE51A|nr:TetR/AcrR family transcriptional regulator [Sphingosinicella sp. LHD-64]MDQ8757538.1 TetR/AcrR family transcriptional regulator [Sphingosinicella sp. LHD-64]